MALDKGQKFLSEVYEQILDITKETNEGRLFFRGQIKPDKLLPGILRENKYKEYEDTIIQQYILSSEICGGRPVETPCKFTTAYEMQHYGLPTRLLDWTFSLNTAIFFALNNYATEKECEPHLYILSPKKLYKKFPNSESRGDQTKSSGIIDMDSALSGSYNYKIGFYGNPKCYIDRIIEDRICSGNHEIVDNVVAIYGEQTNKRILAQQGVFTLHGRNPELSVGDGDYLFDKLIPKDSIAELKNIIYISGTNSLSLMPDLYGLTKSIKDVLVG